MDSGEVIGMAATADSEVSRKELRKFFREIEKYLRAVNTFRAEGHEPHWRGQ